VLLAFWHTQIVFLERRSAYALDPANGGRYSTYVIQSDGASVAFAEFCAWGGEVSVYDIPR
jgi:hypothetical protein